MKACWLCADKPCEIFINHNIIWNLNILRIILPCFKYLGHLSSFVEFLLIWISLVIGLILFFGVFWALSLSWLLLWGFGRDLLKLVFLLESLLWLARFWMLLLMLFRWKRVGWIQSLDKLIYSFFKVFLVLLEFV